MVLWNPKTPIFLNSCEKWKVSTILWDEGNKRYLFTKLVLEIVLFQNEVEYLDIYPNQKLNPNSGDIRYVRLGTTQEPGYYCMTFIYKQIPETD